MTVALGLLLVAVALAVTAPGYLRRAADPRVHPALALWAWMSALVVTPVTALGAAVLLVLPHPAVSDHALGVASTCWRALREGTDMPWLLLARMVLGCVLLGLVGRVVTVLAGDALRARRRRRDRLAALRALACVAAEVWWIPSRSPVAFTVGGGRSGVVVASSAVADLPAPARDAVLAHEQAHRRARHHLATLLARGLARALPWVPLYREAPAAIGVLCELAADAEAVRRCGAPAVTEALGRLGAEHAPSDVVPFGAHPQARRAWLSRRRRLGVRGCGPASLGLAAAAAVLPALGPALGAGALVLAVCLR